MAVCNGVPFAVGKFLPLAGPESEAFSGWKASISSRARTRDR